jgi:2-polyprenyl-3-methyl-5-hydroxy-6-metoxy-1,4-benzoquinol methylase
MPDFFNRSDEAEVMDDLECSGDVLEQTLRELEFINKWLGGNKITLGAIGQLIKSFPDKAITIADLGCGSGEMLRIIDLWGRQKSLNLNLVGIDANPNIIAIAKKNLRDRPNIHLRTLNIFSKEFHDQQYDIVIGTLFYHHFPDKQLTQFFSQLRQQVSLGFVINDIHRHWLAYYSIKILTQFFSKSSMVKYDAPLSVLRAFKKSELEEILQASQTWDFTIRWKWAFRWQVVARVPSKAF